VGKDIFVSKKWLLLKCIAIIYIALNAIKSSAGGLESFEIFLKTAKTGRAEFTQTVTAPARDGQSPKVKISTGHFEFARPHRFKFIYQKPFEQTLVADGQTLWMHDLDLNQVTSSKQTKVLASTPAALIASAVDLKALEPHFHLSSDADQDGLSWMRATPKAKEGSLQSMRVGFKAANAQLAVLDIVDNFGQRSVLQFHKVETNIAIAANAFTFTPPAGADVVKQ
jgi:outer membrane lipoprotein carrier protein